MMSSLFAGVSGLRNHQTKMNVIGNNIANVNTVGYKGSRVTFQDALVQTIKGAGRPSDIHGGTNPQQIGLGMQVGAIDTLWQQGGLEVTGQITDLALQGSGFFILSDGRGEYYTRAGAFGFDGGSYLVDPASGMKVQGKMADPDGRIPPLATIGDIRLPFGQQDPANATTFINLANNLNSAATESTVDATSVNAGTTGIDQVRGTAVNGAGGWHEVVITGDQATQSWVQGTHRTPPALMTGSSTLADLGVVDPSGFTITVDGTTTTAINGLTLDSTVDDLVREIREIAGVNCYLVDTGGGNMEIKIERSYAGNGTDYSVETSAAIGTLGSENIAYQLFGAADGATVLANNGTDITFVVTDTFTPTGKSAEAPTTLDVEVDEDTGLAIGVEGLGGGGVTLRASQGINAGTLRLRTEDTQHSTSIVVYDSQGDKHTAIFTFTKTTTENLWDWEVKMPDQETILEGGSGTVLFNPDGSLLTFAYNGGAASLRFDPGNGASNLDIDINAGDTAGYNGLTGFASPHTASAIYQDGYAMGILEKIDIDQAGVITGIFSNGVSRTLAQLILADFNNEGGLRRVGGNLYQTSANSGAAVHGVAGETVSGTISSGALESSNVDIAQEFTNMITAQRGFQANARIITTSDSMLDELVNLKR